MKVLDLFSGLGGWAKAARDLGHEVVTLDFEPKFNCTITADVLGDDVPDLIRDAFGGGKPDLILASPPCEGFSVLRIGRNWTKPDDDPPHQPKTDDARLALKIVERTRELISLFAPAYFVIENPRAKLRKLPVVGDLVMHTVTYCQLGERFMKPTDLWGGFPPSLVLPPACTGSPKNGMVEIDGLPYVLDKAGEPCHVSAPRGSRTGIQGALSAAERAVIPYKLSEMVVEAAERDIEADRHYNAIPVDFDVPSDFESYLRSLGV
jgi:hypothetical protein